MSVSLKHWRGCRCKPFCRWFYAPVFQHLLQGVPAFCFAVLLFILEERLGVMTPQSVFDSSLPQVHGVWTCFSAKGDCLAQGVHLPSQSPRASAKARNAATVTAMEKAGRKAANHFDDVVAAVGPCELTDRPATAQTALPEPEPDTDGAAQLFKTLQTRLKAVFSQPRKAPEPSSQSARGNLAASGSTHHATTT
jgi:hypothetical protein